jgi:hypothetical protein
MADVLKLRALLGDAVMPNAHAALYSQYFLRCQQEVRRPMRYRYLHHSRGGALGAEETHCHYGWTNVSVAGSE